MTASLVTGVQRQRHCQNKASEYNTPKESNIELCQSKLKARVRRKRIYRHTAQTGTAQILQTLKSQKQLVIGGSGSGFQEDSSLDPFWREITLFQNSAKYDYIQIKYCSSKHITQKERRGETEWGNLSL